ncbi:MAG: TetR/AcrR family transcriptional regulator [Verrucomicrobiaceae bacterium]|nr:TetR/AcrR family transcriptional regulator [Verrucomicrobiaceae bacterium]
MGRVSDAKERLMSAVLELVWTGSYGTTTIDLICEKAGVKKGSFYYFFDSKTELVATALEDLWNSTYRPLMDSLYSPSVAPLDRLKAAVEHAVAEQEEKFRQFGFVLGCPLFSLGNEISTQEQSLRDVIDRILSTELLYLESALREAAAKGTISCADPAFMAKAIFLYWEGALAEARIKNDVKLLSNLWPSIEKLIGLSGQTPTKPNMQAA